MRKYLFISILLPVLLSCRSNENRFDASGTFEADEVIVSSQLSGQLLSFNIEEGDTLSKDVIVGKIDSIDVLLQKQQVQASIQSLREKTSDVKPQVKLLEDQLSVQQTQLNHLLRDQQRFQSMLKDGAVTQRQVDDINTQVDALKQQMLVTQQQINVQRSTTGTQNSSIMSEKNPLEKQVAQLSQQLSKANIVNPVNGTVLTKYAETGEMTSVGKALYKIADVSYLNLRAYITGTQLSTIKLNQPVKVFIDSGANHYRKYDGTIIWISDKAEFTPKTIQTKDERANLVYAIKVKVKNDGYIKIGMYGEVKL
ncbi:MAG TPA: HlyD family efflux transporter periplasmic adaptor subunit [Parafilimonas sp.]|nr:HlyD family efflux transporter periplasmic adaptor subunit [Parafilimonas sp.]